nr:AAA family ATPase [Actinomycetota bacterium]
MSYRRCPKCDAGEIVSDDRGTYCEECGFEPEPLEIPDFEVEDAEAFAAVDEPGAEPLVVSDGGCVIPVGGFVLVYGDGGAGKTTACIDWAVHFAAGTPWLGILEPARPLRILVVENEGPRPEFRRKLRRRLDAWNELEGALGLPLDGRLGVLSEPWAALTLREESHRAALAQVLADVDLVIAGPLSGLGTEGGGTLDEIRGFTALMQEVRELTGHPVAFLLVHHENKAGSISGAWEGSTDVTIHVQPQGHGRTRVYWQKVRWCSALHQTTTHLLWADGDSFIVEEREEITEATIAEAILTAARERPGETWTKIRERVKGKSTTDATAVRDRLIRDGVLVNESKRKDGFNLWAADDPVLIRSEAGTELER